MFTVVLSLKKGAHSHIRGLGLDDALEPRQVRVLTLPFHMVQFQILVKFSYNELRKQIARCRQVTTSY